MSEEIFKDVVGYEGMYTIGDRGTVISYQNGKPKTLTPQNNGQGYMFVRLTKDKQKKYIYVHNLILEAFVGERQNGYEADHINGSTSDNRLENLRYVTRAENLQNCYGRGYVFKNNVYQVSLSVNNRTKYIGCFKTEEEAHAAYISAKKFYHQGFIPDGGNPNVRPQRSEETKKKISDTMKQR